VRKDEIGLKLILGVKQSERRIYLRGAFGEPPTEICGGAIPDDWESPGGAKPEIVESVIEGLEQGGSDSGGPTVRPLARCEAQSAVKEEGGEPWSREPFEAGSNEVEGAKGFCPALQMAEEMISEPTEESRGLAIWESIDNGEAEVAGSVGDSAFEPKGRPEGPMWDIYNEIDSLTPTGLLRADSQFS